MEGPSPTCSAPAVTVPHRVQAGLSQVQPALATGRPCQAGGRGGRGPGGLTTRRRAAGRNAATGDTVAGATAAGSADARSPPAERPGKPPSPEVLPPSGPPP